MVAVELKMGMNVRCLLEIALAGHNYVLDVGVRETDRRNQLKESQAFWLEESMVPFPEMGEC